MCFKKLKQKKKIWGKEADLGEKTQQLNMNRFEQLVFGQIINKQSLWPTVTEWRYLQTVYTSEKILSCERWTNLLPFGESIWQHVTGNGNKMKGIAWGKQSTTLKSLCFFQFHECCAGVSVTKLSRCSRCYRYLDVVEKVSRFIKL